MGIKVTDLELSHVKAGATRQRIHDLTDTPKGPTFAQREAFATRHKERNVTKYWSFETVLAALDLWHIRPVFTKTGEKFTKDGSLLIYSLEGEDRAEEITEEQKGARRARMTEPVITTKEEAEAPQQRSSEEERARKREALRQMIAREIEEARGKDDEALKQLIAGVSHAAAGAVLDTKGGELLKAIKAHGDKVLKEALAKIDEARPVVHIFKSEDGEKEVKLEGILHEAIGDVMDLADMRKNIAMIGPTGCGKTHLAEQVGRVLAEKWGFDPDTAFGTISCTLGMSETKITGGFLPTGEAGRFEPYVTDFVRIYRDGGVFLLDEWDAADDNVALQVNSALSNGYIDLQGLGRIKRHENFVCIAALNTHGTGANRMYTSRSQLDEATLDRFRIGQVEMDYDRKLEAAIIPDRAWLDKAWAIRDRLNDAGLRRNVSTRFIKDGHDMMKGKGWSMEKVLKVFTSGWSQNERAKAGIDLL